MSWQTYVDTNLIGAGGSTAAGIYDLEGNPWAYSPGFAAQIDEMQYVAHAMKSAADDSGVAGTLAPTGAVVAGVKYMFVRGDKNEVYVKKGQTGVFFVMCNTCVVVSFHDDKIQTGQCTSTTAKLTDYLKDNGI